MLLPARVLLLPGQELGREAGGVGARIGQRLAPRQTLPQSLGHGDGEPRILRDLICQPGQSAGVLGRTVLTIPQQAGEDGRLFGSVTAQDIADAIRDARGLKIDRRKIHIDDPIKTVGTYMVEVEVADGVTTTVKTMVVDQK